MLQIRNARVLLGGVHASYLCHTMYSGTTREPAWATSSTNLITIVHCWEHLSMPRLFMSANTDILCDRTVAEFAIVRLRLGSAVWRV